MKIVIVVFWFLSSLNVYSELKSLTGTDLLLSQYTERNKTGMSFFQAQNLCREYKEKYRNDYFHVFCVYHNKSWTEYGITITSKEWKRELTDWFSREVWEKSYWQLERHPYHHSRTGLWVYGLGSVSSLTEKMILDLTHESYFGFSNEREAFHACRKMIIGLDDTDFKFYKAYCRSSRSSQDNRYRFKIFTLNPLY